MRPFFIFTCLTLALTGCNTFTGIGRDLAYVGNSMTDFASDVRGEPENPNAHVPAPTYSGSGQQDYSR